MCTRKFLHIRVNTLKYLLTVIIGLVMACHQIFKQETFLMLLSTWADLLDLIMINMLFIDLLEFFSRLKILYSENGLPEPRAVASFLLLLSTFKDYNAVNEPFEPRAAWIYLDIVVLDLRKKTLNIGSGTTIIEVAKQEDYEHYIQFILASQHIYTTFLSPTQASWRSQWFHF